MLALQVKTRAGKDSAEDIRADGFVPAVFYGPKEESTSIAVDARTLEKIWHEAGETTVVTLQGAGEEKDALIHDIQVHPVTGVLLHADFYVLEKGKKVQISIPLHFEGEAPAEKAGHILVKALHEIEIEVAPQDLPHHLPVDISKLVNVGDHIVASQIPLPKSAALITHGDEIVASITEFKEEKFEEIVPTPVAEVEGAAPAATEAPAPSEEAK